MNARLLVVLTAFAGALAEPEGPFPGHHIALAVQSRRFRGEPVDRLGRIFRANSTRHGRKPSYAKPGWRWAPDGERAEAVEAASYGDKIRKINRRLKDATSSTALPGTQSPPTASNVTYEGQGTFCNFESACPWAWNASEVAGEGFLLLDAEELLNGTLLLEDAVKGPLRDADDNIDGHFLFLTITSGTQIMIMRSPIFSELIGNCNIEVSLYQKWMQQSTIKMVVEPRGSPPVVIGEVQGNNNEIWEILSFPMAKVQSNFQVILEVVPFIGNDYVPLGAYLAIDNLEMVKCFPEMPPVSHCTARQLKCTRKNVTYCAERSAVCDITVDCDDGEDEKQNCQKIPMGGRCSFEDGWCGFSNAPSSSLKLLWSLHSGASPTYNTGPDHDHTCGSHVPPTPPSPVAPLLLSDKPDNTSKLTCKYLLVDMSQHGNDKNLGFASNANLNSVVFNPPPKVHGNETSRYYNSCMVRFNYHQHGKNTGSLALAVVEMRDHDNVTTNLFFSSDDHGNVWKRHVAILPNITNRYYFTFEARKGMRIFSDVAIDDFSLSPECFGLNIEKQHLADYNYWDPIYSMRDGTPHADFVKNTYYRLTRCGANGRFGPNQTMCDRAYQNTSVSVRVSKQQPMAGIQSWTVPIEGHYMIIASGAGGGMGSVGAGSSRGSQVRALFELHKGEVIHVLVGQAGANACIKTLSQMLDTNCLLPQNTESQYYSKTHEVKNLVVQNGGGGGGGATFVFLKSKAGSFFPLIVSAGGGGLSSGKYVDDGVQHGKGAMVAGRTPKPGHMWGKPGETSGAGGGWFKWEGPVTPGLETVRGLSLLEGGVGGAPCNADNEGVNLMKEWAAMGGFGGGGGGCTKGGGGGGYSGGDTSLELSSNGGGGYSYVDRNRSVTELSAIFPSFHSGHGEVYIIPAIQGCSCDYRCVALDVHRSKVQCICPTGWQMKSDSKTACELIDTWQVPYFYVVIGFAVVTLVLCVMLSFFVIVLYNRYQHKKEAELRRKRQLEQELQLRRLRNAPGGDDLTLTAFNPHYGCDGFLNTGVDVRALPQVCRDSLRLIRALGQGAFGEVYEGLYKHRDEDAVEMPVAVKTLPEMSTEQAENDFFMEAAIMAKFNHPNIVHLIGVCFDIHPRFIVLELLSGGDLKVFLRENRPKLECPSTLTMKDLLLCSVDVARGCRYMESKRFIHRDIAARNCLLTSRGPGRVVKIADYGMARDIYRADYYRKGGKALLPIKWMPPESFLDGVFTTKSDVCDILASAGLPCCDRRLNVDRIKMSFGILLWEVFSLGVMPYTGCSNKEVMQVVINGGRLEAPHGCPEEIYRMMSESWNPTPRARPSFSALYDRLSLTLQDSEILAMELPSYSNLIKEAYGSTASVQGTQDYLVPRDPDSLEAEGITIEGNELRPAKGAAALPNTVVYEPSSSGQSLLSRDQRTPKRVFTSTSSTDRLLRFSEETSVSDEEVTVKDQVCETSFIETPPPPLELPEEINEIRPPPVELHQPENGSKVAKLISIDTPVQTPTSVIAPVTIEPPPPLAPKGSSVSVHKPLSLDAARLEQNLNALKKKSGSVDLNNMNIVPPYINVVTPNHKLKHNKKIEINPKKAVIYSDMKKLKSPTLTNGILADLPFVDSDGGSGSNSSHKSSTLAVCHNHNGNGSSSSGNSSKHNYKDLHIGSKPYKKSSLKYGGRQSHAKNDNDADDNHIYNETEISC